MTPLQVQGTVRLET